MPAAAAVAAAVRIRIALRSRVLVKLLRNCIERLLHFVGRSLNGGNVGTLLCFLQLFDGGQNRSLVTFGDLVAHLVQGLFRLIDDLIGRVAGIDLVLAGFVLRRILLQLP